MYGAESWTGYRPEMASIPRGADANRRVQQKKNNALCFKNAQPNFLPGILAACIKSTSEHNNLELLPRVRFLFPRTKRVCIKF